MTITRNSTVFFSFFASTQIISRFKHTHTQNRTGLNALSVTALSLTFQSVVQCFAIIIIMRKKLSIDHRKCLNALSPRCRYWLTRLIIIEINANRQTQSPIKRWITSHAKCEHKDLRQSQNGFLKPMKQI